MKLQVTNDSKLEVALPGPQFVQSQMMADFQTPIITPLTQCTVQAFPWPTVLLASNLTSATDMNL